MQCPYCQSGRTRVIDTTHDPEPVQAPLHPAKLHPLAGVALKVTDVPLL